MPAGDTEATPHPPVQTIAPPTVAEPISRMGDDLPPTLAASSRPEPKTGEQGMLGRDIIGQYVIRSKIGEGGMGEVYLAEQPAIGRHVAIKVLHSGLIRTSEGAREGIERFRNEAKAAARLESPHIVQIFNWGELDDGTLFMAMEYLSGVTLASLLRERGQLEPELAVHITTQICSALTEAHAAGIVHRDLKPSNIMMIERAGDPHFAKVLDFGVAKLEGADITRSGALFGTPQYMSPEQLQAGQIDGRSDLYALGVILFELLAGKPPFSSPTAIGFITLHLNEPPPALPKTVPRALAAAIMRLLAKDPDERPRDAAIAAEELRAALSGRAPRASAKQRRRALRSVLNVIGLSAAISGLTMFGWWIWQQQVQTQQQLDAERARSEGLETALAEESARAQKAREEARASTREARDAGEKARAERTKALEQGATEIAKPSAPLSAETRKLVGLDQAELLRNFEAVLAEIKLPPSEIADIQNNYRDAAASKSKDELHDHLVNLIAVYRRVEQLKPGDRLPLGKLEQTFRNMVTREPMTIEQREEILAATAAELADDPTLDPADRAYFQRLAVAKSIRQYALDPKLIDRPGKSPVAQDDTPEPALPGSKDKPGKHGGKDSGGGTKTDTEQDLPAPGDEGSSPPEASGSTSGSQDDEGLDSLPGLDEAG
ncbi:protein kinase domain-containing protein [Nannocystaceae bacterium ST9]